MADEMELSTGVSPQAGSPPRPRVVHMCTGSSSASCEHRRSPQILTATHATPPKIQGAGGAPAAPAGKATSYPATTHLPWVEKYRPSSLDDLVAHEEIISIITVSVRTPAHSPPHAMPCHATGLGRRRDELPCRGVPSAGRVPRTPETSAAPTVGNALTPATTASNGVEPPFPAADRDGQVASPPLLRSAGHGQDLHHAGRGQDHVRLALPGTSGVIDEPRA